MSARESDLASGWERGAASQLGGRKEQQDRWSLFSPPRPDGLLAVLADGMGGHLDGALGAQTVADVARRFVRDAAEALYADPAGALDQLCRQMHDAINAQSETARSTVVMAWLDRDRAHWLNVGDSRLYHFREGQRLMRTRDHSAVQLLMDLGEISESDMANHPAQNRLYRCLGGAEIPKPDAGQFAIQDGDLLVLCSDGVWEHVTEAELWETTLAHGPATAARALADEAVRRGGNVADNATLILLRASAGTAAPPRWLRRVSAGFASLFHGERQ
ncbi:MAG: serine/threonine-protein phosphatase [Candidatus Competibacteraceae bacterium]|nr:serine/threonine-protein phosphatase [Candidatus Competibacteraceae bacterium]